MTTFSDEVRCIWQRKFTGATALFCINRYAALLVCTLRVILDLQTSASETADLVSLFPLFIQSYITDNSSGVSAEIFRSVSTGPDRLILQVQ